MLMMMMISRIHIHIDITHIYQDYGANAKFLF